MDDLMTLVALILGLLLLWKCADVLVSGAVGLAGRFHISAMVIGLTIVAMGTSAPEVAASLAAVFDGPQGGDTAIGNIFGSNIANLALVGGMVALIRPLRIRRQTLVRDLPVMLAVCLLLGGALYNHHIARWEALSLLGLFTLLTWFTAYTGKQEAEEHLQQSPVADSNIHAGTTKPPPWKEIGQILLGLVGLTGGAKLTIFGALAIGRALGLGEGVIGLSIVAIGTSLPELITCAVAALRGHDDLSVGNLVGSNIFNALLVTGVAGLARPFGVSPRFAWGPDFWIMIAVCILFLGLSAAGKGAINRVFGGILLAGYAAFLIYLGMNPA